ncbi:hypothetical protein BJ878DRAFT_569715 [Calycina marina]|uniref:M protein repeat protein n=1 Tax=Calycina marina TaxID=1763456 RepID=A0A9P8CCF9_9HELO|nr:hypothetical protein BJ878DRAFT_569715 [Calycina marina]
MADEEKAKAEKLAAAKKRVEALKKKKTAKAGTKKEEAGESSPALKEGKNIETEAEPTTENAIEQEKGVDAPKDAEDTIAELGKATTAAQQSRMRSSSFRQASGGLPSPGYGFPTDGDTAPAIYQKQAARIDELEKENKRVAKEASEAEKRWKKLEDELEDLRDADSPVAMKASQLAPSNSSGEVEKLRTEIAALQRQNSQLQTQSTRRHVSSPSMSGITPPGQEAALAAKDSTIESMEFEISNLRAQMERIASGSSVEREQIAALEDKLARSERSAATAQRELGDLKKNLQHTTAKAIKEGSERTSAETKLRTLEREADDAKTNNLELQKKVDALEKKAATLATLHKEHDARFQTQKRDLEKAEKTATESRSKLAHAENEAWRLREEKEQSKKRDAQGVDDDGVDELENEGRQRLEKKVRELEGEVHELRKGIWRERRTELDGGDGSGAGFTDVDLGGMSPNRQRSLAPGARGISDYITSGLNAITGASANDGVLLDDDDDMDFDEDAFRLAQEEEAKKRIERVKEIKRGLKSWEGWRLDLVENRKDGSEGIGEIFEI